jgi:hypothetical protein
MSSMNWTGPGARPRAYVRCARKLARWLPAGVAIGLLAACAGPVGGPTEVAPPSVVVASSGLLASGPDPTEVPGLRQYQVGDAIEISCASAACLTVTIDKVSFAKAYWDKTRMLDDIPEDAGDVFLAFHVVYHAVGKNAAFGSSDWTVYANGSAADVPTAVLHGPKPELDAGPLAVGASSAGWVVQEVPATGPLAVGYQPAGVETLEVVIPRT